MKKPAEIESLEKFYKITINQLSEFEKVMSYENRNTYFVNEKLQITGLNLSNNQITDINALKGLTALNKLYLSINKITDINPLKGLTALDELYLSDNQISDINTLKGLTALNEIDLSDNQISDINPLKGLTALCELDLASNQISDINPLKGLTALKELNLSSNQISDINPLKRLTALQDLELSDNKISDINPLKGLTALEGLYLSYNQIFDITPIQYLKKFKFAFLDTNQLSDLRPLENLIYENKKLNFELEYNGFEGDKSFLYIGRNHFTIPPVEVIEQGNDTILQYFNDAKQYGLQALNECKLIFVGDGGLGKTSLMKKIIGLPFCEEKTTHGINKKSWNEIKNAEGQPVKVNLWDFGGQHIQHSLHQFFLTEKVVYILLLDPRNDTSAIYWLEQIDKLGKGSEVLIVYNWKEIKDKESHNNKNFYELRKKYPELKEPFLLSCKDDTDTGFEQFKTKLINIILNRKDLLVQYPKNWFNIKEELEANVTVDKNYIAYNEYEKTCDNFKYYNDTNRKNLLKQLDKIGSIVFFDKPILNEFQVLNPDWITTGAYSVITSEITRNNKGHLENKDLKEIFKDEKYLFANKNIKLTYKEKDFKFILSLMNDYDLCVHNPFNTDDYLVPCAFEGEMPNEFESYKLDCKRYRFKFESAFEMLIMYRFMARNISKCIENGYWQSGIVLKDQDAKTTALIETNQHSSIIDFWIKGENIRGLWEVLRNDIKHIISKYSLKYSEEVQYRQNDYYDNQEIFLSYDEMIRSLYNGIRVIDYHPTNGLKNINVLDVIDNFEDSTKTIKNMEKEGNHFYGPVKFKNSQLGSGNTQNNYTNSYSDNPKIEELKMILGELEDAKDINKEWQENFTNAFVEVCRLEDAKDAATEKKSISKLRTFFNKAKEIKDWVAISVIPAEITTKGGKMLELGTQLFEAINKIDL